MVFLDSNYQFVKKINCENFGIPEQIHGIKVANLCIKLVDYIELELDKESLYLAALIHDIGLGKIDRSLINKNGKLTSEEKLIIKDHSLYSAEMCQEIGLSDEIVSTVLYHHENLDGSGYPEGIGKKEIPVASKILRICDVFVALTSKRPYRDKFTVEESLEIMEGVVNTFDEFLLSNFRNMIFEKND